MNKDTKMVLRVRGLRGWAGIRWMLKNPNHSVQKPYKRQNFQTLYANVVFVKVVFWTWKRWRIVQAELPFHYVHPHRHFYIHLFGVFWRQKLARYLLRTTKGRPKPHLLRLLSRFRERLCNPITGHLPPILPQMSSQKLFWLVKLRTSQNSGPSTNNSIFLFQLSSV